MSLTILGSIRGAPGCTTAALAVGCCLTESILVEADTAGGVLALRLGLGGGPGLAELAVAVRQPTASLDDFVQFVPGAPAVVAAPASGPAVRALLRNAGGRLVDALRSSDSPVLVDAGRLPGHPWLPELARGDRVIVVTDRSSEQLRATRASFGELTEHPATVSLLLVGPATYATGDIERQLGLPIFGTLPDDPRGASALNGTTTYRPSMLRRTPLARAARAVAEDLHQMELTAR